MHYRWWLWGKKKHLEQELVVFMGLRKMYSEEHQIPRKTCNVGNDEIPCVVWVLPVDIGNN